MTNHLILVCVAALAGPAWAQTNPTASETAAATTVAAPAARARVSIAATEMPLRRAAQMLSEQSGHTILIGPETTGRLTMNVTDVSLEAALSVTARVSDNRWSRFVVPADKAKTLTPEQALTLVTAAETLASSALAVQSGDGPAVSVGVSPEAPRDAVTVYFIHTKADVAAIRAAREAAKKAEEARDTPAPAVAASMSEDARNDPKVVGAYSALQMLSPNQVAVLTREFLIHSTPEQRQSIGEAFAEQREQLRDAMRQQPGQQ